MLAPPCIRNALLIPEKNNTRYQPPYWINGLAADLLWSSRNDRHMNLEYLALYNADLNLVAKEMGVHCLEMFLI